MLRLDDSWKQQQFQKSWDRGIFTTLLCHLFNNTLCLANEYTNYSHFESRISSHSFLIYNFICSAEWYLLGQNLHFIMCHTFSKWDRCGLQSGQSSTCTVSQWSHADVTCVECGLPLSLWNMQGCPITCRSKTCMCNISGVFTDGH